MGGGRDGLKDATLVCRDVDKSLWRFSTRGGGGGGIDSLKGSRSADRGSLTLYRCCSELWGAECVCVTEGLTKRYDVVAETLRRFP